MFFVCLSISLVLCLAWNVHKMSLKKLLYINGILILSFILFLLHVHENEYFIQKKVLSNIILFDDSWQFSCDQKNWINITLPHTVEKSQGTCFYRKQLIIDDISLHRILRFDAAMHEVEVWINDKHIARHLGGYLPFYIDLPIIPNRILNILVQLRNSVIPLSKLDFNYYGGLYQHVWLTKQSNQFRLNHSIRIDYENVTKTQAIVIVRFNIISNANNSKDCHIQFSLNKYEIYPISIKNNNEAVFLIYNPRLWSPSQPHLYHFTIELLDKGTKQIIYDHQTITIGIRSFQFHPNSSNLFINGEKFDFMVGTNYHQEYPYIGNALSDSAQYRDAYKIKQAGFNLVRCPHYPPSTAFLNACDYLGILVINSIPHWQYFGNETLEKNSYSDIEALITRDYNHPSIVLWEVSFNKNATSKEFMKQAHEIIKKNKPDGLTCGSMDEENAYDVFILPRQHGNAPDYYKNYRAKNDKMLFIAEYGDWEYYEKQGNSKDKEIDQFETSAQRRKDGQKQAKIFQEAHNNNRRSSQTARIMGDANWLMFDHKRGHAPDIQASGIMDINRLPKFAFYFYRSQCTTCPPMIFIANYWTDPSDTMVTVYTNCDNVELRLKNVLIVNGERVKNNGSSDLLRPPFTFKIDTYIPGRLEAIGFKNGKSVVRTYRLTPEKIHHHLGIEIDYSGKSLSKNDVVFVYAYIYDKNNMIIPDADDLIEFSLLNARNQAFFIGQNPVRAEAGIATILLKTSFIVSSNKMTIIASSSSVKKQETRVVISITS